MAKSITRKNQQRFTKNEKTIIDIAAIYISEWTKREFNKLRTESGNPICYPIGSDGYYIGKCKITRIHDDCWRVQDRNDELVQDFTNKTVATIYCIYEQQAQHWRCIQLKNLDAELGRTESNIMHYQNSINRAKKRSDWDAVHEWSSRLTAIQSKRIYLRAQMEKTINIAKYIKIWDPQE